MPDNLFFGPDAQINHTIGMMQAEKSEGAITDGARVSPNVFFVVDPEGQIAGNFETGDGNVLKMSYQIIKPARWIGLHITAGNFDLQGRSILGLIAKSRSDHAVTSRACLRSGYEGGFTDSFLPKHIVSYAETSTHIDLLQIEKDADLPQAADWRELVFFLPPADTHLAISELKFFVV